MYRREIAKNELLQGKKTYIYCKPLLACKDGDPSSTERRDTCEDVERRDAGERNSAGSLRQDSG